MEQIAGYLDTNSPDSSELSSERGTAASLNVPTPQKELRNAVKARAKQLPMKICLTDVTQLDKSAEEMNKTQQCCTPGCSGNLAHLKV